MEPRLHVNLEAVVEGEQNCGPEAPRSAMRIPTGPRPSTPSRMQRITQAARTPIARPRRRKVL